MLITYIYFFNKGARKGQRADLDSLAKRRNNFEFIINYIYKFKVFKLSPILFFYIY